MSYRREKNLPHDADGKVTAGPGRQKGQVNIYSKIIRDAVLMAGNKAGGKEGLVGYLEKQAKAHPAAFMTLLGKAMPLQLQGSDRGGRVIVEIVKQAGHRVQQDPPKLIEGAVVNDDED